MLFYLPCSLCLSFKGVDLHKLSFNIGVRVMEVLQAFGANEAASQVEAALSAAGAANAQGAAAAPASATSTAAASNGASAVPNMHDCIAAITAASRIGGEKDQSQQHQQQLQQQPASPTLHHQHSTSAAAVMSLAAAAAAVAAPQPLGPCLTLAQLLVYAVALLQAVLPLLGQLLLAAAASGPGTHDSLSGGLAAGAAYELQLRAVVQHLELVGQQIGSQHTSQEDILRLGVLLVQLCSTLLHDDAAGASVSQQVVQHASDFAGEAAVYLMQGSHTAGAAPPGPAVMLQQLTAALQHLQHLLSQAVQHA